MTTHRRSVRDRLDGTKPVANSNRVRTAAGLRSTSPGLSRALDSNIRRLGPLWASVGYSLPAPGDVYIEIAHRFTARLASYDASRSVIRLRRDATTWPKRALREVLVHELAHAAVYGRLGGSASPHGAEWRALVTAAGVQASPRLAAGCRMTPQPKDGATGTRAHRRSRFRYEHRCQVCGFVRVSSRSVSGWRCGECITTGLDGRLSVSKLPFPKRRS